MNGHIPSEPGSRPSDKAASRLSPSGFDPLRVEQTEVDEQEFLRVQPWAAMKRARAKAAILRADRKHLDKRIKTQRDMLAAVQEAQKRLKDENACFREALEEIRRDPNATVWELIYVADMALKKQGSRVSDGSPQGQDATRLDPDRDDSAAHEVGTP